MRTLALERPTPARAGLTIVELILALGLFALLATAVVQLIATTLDVWEEAEANREQLAREAALTEWFRRDLEYLATGKYGDLLCDWELFDVDGDGIATRPAPRLRLVRRATAEDLRRLGQRRLVDASGETAVPPAGARPLIEVAWLLLPPAFGPKEVPRGAGLLMRGERLLDAPGSYFDRAAFDGSGKLLASPAEPIATEVLHWRVLFASQTSSLTSGWRVGADLASVSSAWDAKGLDRPNAERHPLNLIAAGSPAYLDAAILPRRVRVEFELQRPADAPRRPVLVEPLGPDGDSFLVRGSR
ncbi:MAG: hypothetical protein AAFZ65_14635, partial [Planctomycetota bacterium]